MKKTKNLFNRDPIQLTDVNLDKKTDRVKTTTLLYSRFDPNPQSRMLFVIPEGSILTVLEELENWLYIKNENGQLGYIRKSFTEREVNDD